jgi:hypothetical protein
MSGYIVSCETLPFVDSNGVIYCTSPVIRETPPALIDLTAAEVKELSDAVLWLFAIAFLARFVRQFLEAQIPGRN